jgi:dUTP pyrophosphatase
MMLNESEIMDLIRNQDLIKGYINLETQLQPSGFDLSLTEIRVFDGHGSVDFSNKKRTIAKTIPIKQDEDGWYHLSKGCYQIVYNEIVKMPLDLVAIARTRSTLLRNGATVETAVWDPGYKGRSSSLLVVHNKDGMRLKKDARVVQLIFFKTHNVGKGYRGIFQDERMKEK